MKRAAHTGFTLVELIIVIAVIGILAGIVTAYYAGWREDVAETAMRSDLDSFVAAMNEKRNFTNEYPTSIPGDFSPSSGNVIQLVGATTTSFCVDVYSLNSPGLVLSYDSTSDTVRTYPCSGMPSGSPVGGSMPNAPRNVNLSGDFTGWALAGTATVSGGVLTLGSNGTATTPPIRVSSPNTISVGGDFYATQQTPYVPSQPNAMYHINVYYYGSDGTTPATNANGQTANGCAQSFTRGSWQNGVSKCNLTGGPNVIYARFRMYSTASNYASPDLQVRNPSLRVSD